MKDETREGQVRFRWTDPQTGNVSDVWRPAPKSDAPYALANTLRREVLAAGTRKAYNLRQSFEGR